MPRSRRHSVAMVTIFHVLLAPMAIYSNAQIEYSRCYYVLKESLNNYNKLKRDGTCPETFRTPFSLQNTRKQTWSEHCYIKKVYVDLQKKFRWVKTKTKKKCVKQNRYFVSLPPGAFIWRNMVYMCKMVWATYDDGH